MMKKILLIAICLLFLCSKVNAVSVNNDYSIKENKISIKNNTFDMYVTFTNDKDAFSILNNKSHNLIEYIKNKYNYTDISSLNVDKYLAKYYEEYEYIDDNYPGEGMSLIKFYDIFENKKK